MKKLTKLEKAQTMSSLELVKIINKIRKEEFIPDPKHPESAFKELAHDNFLKKIVSVLGEKVAVRFYGYYIASNGKKNLK